MIKKWFGQFLFVCFIISASVVWAQPDNSQEEEIKQAFQEAQKVQQVGPVEITLLDQAKFKLPANYIYIPQPQAGRIMKSMGNSDNPGLIGLVFPGKNSENWVTTIKYQKSGYIKDDDAKNWNIDDLFNGIKNGTEEANKERKQRGFPEVEIVDWVEKPQYNSASHRLVWSIAVKEKGAVNTGEQGINYQTYALGREGYLTLCLITDLKDIEAQKPIAAQLLASIEFVSGKRYEDFNASTDKVAEYGLAALIAGVAAKKLGLFAVVAAFVLKFAKIIGLAVLGAGGVLTKYFRKNKNEDSTQATPPEN